MAFSKVYNMDIIPHTGAVRSIVIIAEYAQPLQLANRNLGDIRHQIIRDSLWILSDAPALMRAYRVEVPQQDNVPFWMGLLKVRHNLLHHGLSPSVWIGALSLRTLFCDRNNLRASVYRGRRTEYDVLHAHFVHHAHQGQCSGYIVMVVFQWLLYRFPNCFQRRTMDDSIDTLCLKHCFQRVCVQYIAFIELQGLACQFFYSLD